AADAIRENAEEVTALDQAIGDGDHVTNLQRGLDTLQRIASDLEQLGCPAALQKIGMSLMSAVGGASGSLYGTLFIAMGKALQGKEVSAATLAAAFGEGVEAVKQRGKADVGEKTMLDVLIPVATAWRSAAQQNIGLAEMSDAIGGTAEQGCESTRNLIATKGRASFLGERARGHLDPGARTSELMIGAITRILNQES
ncbi:MAG: dihydroxyacetone phosphatase, partial [Proteobacteria bacterium]|nr:dihydroxyacetone phosphatase [Pseudomonadota bacterium]